MLRCKATHLQSGSVLETDAPTDNRGKGERFSPTDTACVALATCVVTTMGIKAGDMGIDLAGAELQVQKHMTSNPRRIEKIEVLIRFPELGLDDAQKKLLENTGNNCPVHHAMKGNVEMNIQYEWQ
jgi:putative redox protein